MRILLLILLFFLLSPESEAQYRPKRIRIKGDYIHNPTKYVFPSKVDGYNREKIYSFNKKKTNIGVIYKSKDLKTKISTYLYPAGDGTENRLRVEYLVSLQSVANAASKGIDVKQHPVSFSNSGYKVNGFKGLIESFNKRSSLSVYECGKWFFKIRITSENKDSIELEKTETYILNYFIPTKLVEYAPLNPKADVSFAKAAFVDSLMLGAAMGSAFRKIGWAFENIDSLERASGFPGLYLDMHIESLKEYVSYEEKHPKMTKTQSTKDYLKELNLIIDSGFLEEFIMEQYSMVMIVPENMNFDFEGFRKWKIKHPININLNEMFYLIWFSE